MKTVEKAAGVRRSVLGVAAKREIVGELRAKGRSYSDISELLGIAKSTVHINPRIAKSSTPLPELPFADREFRRSGGKKDSKRLADHCGKMSARPVHGPLREFGPHASATLPRFMKRAICLMTLPVAALAAGCGSGGGSSSTIATPTVPTQTTLSKDQFIKEGDGICAEVNAALGSLSSSSTSSANLASQRADLYEGMISRLRGLGTPDDQTGLDQVLSAGDDIVTAEQKVVEATNSNDSAALSSAETEASSAESSFSSAASSYGFKDCGGAPTTPSSTITTTPSTAVPVTPTTATPAPVTPAPTPGATGTGGGTAGTGTSTGGGSTGTGTGGGSTGTGTGGTSGSGGVGPG
jgi:hypothetical protein